jgi:hypothetical protein
MAPTIISTVVVPAAAQFNGAAPLDLIALDEVKEELRITGRADDRWLRRVITRSSSLIARYCDRVFQPQTYREYFQAARDPYPWQLPSGFFPLQLSAWPLASPPSPAGTTPPLAPQLTAGSGGSLAAGTYYARLSYVTANGETAASLESSVIVGASGSIAITAPIADLYAAATGWNVYVGTRSYGETRQTVSPQPMAGNFTLTSLSTAGAAVPSSILVVENFPENPQPLAEGIDFVSDYTSGPPDFSVGWLTRLFLTDATPRRWSGLPIVVLYQAGFPQIPPDLADAALQLVKARYFARTRDPRLRSRIVPGVYESTWAYGAGPGAEGDLPLDVMAMLDRYRVPVMA